jgi:AcrR family transcriptional regulator
MALVNRRLTQAERTEISDMKMLDATVDLIVSRGPSATSLKEVGLKAGYSRGLASQRFGSKDNLMAFVLRNIGDVWLQQLKSATFGKTGIEAIHRALDEHYRFCLEAPKRVRAFYTLWFESVNAGTELETIIEKIHRRRHQDVARWIMNEFKETEMDSDRTDIISSHFCAAIIGIVYYWLTKPEDQEHTKKLHDNLKNTMTLLLQER